MKRRELSGNKFFPQSYKDFQKTRLLHSYGFYSVGLSEQELFLLGHINGSRGEPVRPSRSLASYFYDSCNGEDLKIR